MRHALALALTLVAAPALAQDAWPVDAMNRVIDQTNFVVDGGCSGTLISVPERLVLTNFHCVEKSISTIERDQVGDDGVVRRVKMRRLADLKVEQHSYVGFARVGTSSYVAEIVADSKARDLAVLRIKGPIPHIYASPLLPEGSKITRGERVYVVGNPALEDATVVEGIVSNVNRTFEFPWTGGEKLAMVQFSGGIFGGNSGGALYNAAGELIGVPAAGYREATFIGFAVPIDVVKSVLRDNCLAQVFDEHADDARCRTDKSLKRERD